MSNTTNPRMLTRLATRWIHLNKTSNPHKLILVHLEHRNEVARALSERICHELRVAHLNAQPTDKIIESPHVPFTIVLTERTMFDGVARLQHHKPRINEEVHVADLRERILQQMGSVTARGPPPPESAPTNAVDLVNDDNKA